MALNFPASPELNETYTAGGVVYVWDGVKWTSKGSESGIPLLPDAEGNVTIVGTLTVQGATITGNAITATDITAETADLSGDLNVAGDIIND